MHIKGCSEALMYFFLFFLFEIHHILYIDLVTILTYIVLIFILYWCIYVFHLPLHMLFLFFLYTHGSYILYEIYYFCFTLRCRDKFCLKCFRNTGYESLLATNSLLAVFQEFVLGYIFLYSTSEYELSDLWLLSYVHFFVVVFSRIAKGGDC